MIKWPSLAPYDVTEASVLTYFCHHLKYLHFALAFLNRNAIFLILAHFCLLLIVSQGVFERDEVKKVYQKSLSRGQVKFSWP